ncbi:hypothetical protein V2J09_001828 [Rumex salicifolius]
MGSPRLGTEDQNEWYFFSHKDKKYPTGTRTNRATVAGFWKATGRDKAIYSKHDLIGMRKTLVFYKGRAPNGQKSDWIMHEYRLETDENGTSQASMEEEGWVVCRVFKKRMATTMRRMGDHDSPLPYWYDDTQVSFMPSDSQDDLITPKQASQSVSMPSNYHHHHYPFNPSCKKELQNLPYQMPQDSHLQLFQNPRFLPALPGPSNCEPSFASYGLNINQDITMQPIQMSQEDHKLQICNDGSVMDDDDQVTDWRVLDKFVASQLSQGDTSSKPNN